MKTTNDSRKALQTIKLSETTGKTLKEIRTRMQKLDEAMKAANESSNAFLIALLNRDDIEELNVEWNDEFTELTVYKNDNNKGASK